MNKISFVTAFFLFLCLYSSKGQTNLDSQLRNFPIATYLNRPIDTLLANLPAGFDSSFVISSTSSLNSGATLQVNYHPNYLYWIDVKITDPQFITVRKNYTTGRPEQLWPLDLLRKEKVGSITIYTGAYEIINRGSIL